MLIALAAILGLAVGSFLNVVAHRVPAGHSVIRPPSACPQCDKPIRVRDNIPVLSWLILRGKCRDCGERISVRYPIVEVGTAALFGLTAGYVGAEWALPAYLWFAGVATVLILTDLDHKRIPDRILFPGVVVGLVLLALGSAADGELFAFGRGVLGALGYFVLLWALAEVFRGGLGFGDVKLAFLLGLFTAYVSWATWVAGVFLAFFTGGVVAVLLLATRRRGRKDAIAFGPSLIAGALVAVAVGQPLVDWYLG